MMTEPSSMTVEVNVQGDAASEKSNLTTAASQSQQQKMGKEASPNETLRIDASEDTVVENTTSPSHLCQSLTIEDDVGNNVMEHTDIAMTYAQLEQPKPVYEVDYDEDPTSLYTVIEMRDWDSVKEFAQDPTGPREAATWVCRKEKGTSTIRWRLLPLHASIVFKAPEDVIQVLIDAYPDGASCQDDQGMIPLHLAFRHSLSDSIIFDLLNAYPDGIKIKDGKGRLPLSLMPKPNDSDPPPSPETPAKGFWPLTPARREPATPKSKKLSGIALYVTLTAEEERRNATLETKKKFNEKLAEEKDKAAKELAAAKSRTAEVESDLARVRSASEALFNQYLLKQKEEERLKKCISENEEQNTILQNMNDQCSKKSGDLEKQNAGFTIEVSKLKGLVAILENENKRLKGFQEKVERLEENGMAYETELTDKRDLITSQSSELERLKGIEEKVGGLESANTAYEKELNESRIKIGEQETEIERLKGIEDKVGGLDSANATHAKELKESRTKIGEQEKEIERLKGIEEKVEELEEANMTYKMEHSASLDKIIEQETHLQRCRDIIIELKSKLGEELSREHELKVALSAAEDRLSQVTTSHEEDVIAMKKNLTDKDSRVAVLRDVKRALESDVADLEKKQHEFAEAISSSRIQICELKDTLKRTDTENIILRDKVEVMNRVTSKIHEQLKESQKSDELHKKQLALCSEELDSASMERRHLQQQVKQASAKNVFLESQVNDLNSQICNLSSKLSVMSKEQETVLEAAMKQEKDLRDAMELKGSMMEAIAREMKESQASADLERSRIMEAARKQKQAIDAVFNSIHLVDKYALTEDEDESY